MLRRLAAVLAVFGLLLYAWPLWSAWQLRAALKARDTAALQARVDWPQLRTNLKPRIAAAVREDADKSTGIAGTLKRAIGGAVAERAIDFVVTPQNLARIMAGREFFDQRIRRETPQSQPKDPPAPQSEADAEDIDDPVPPRRLRYAFFESLGRFRIEATHPRVPGGRIVAILAQQGLGWRLADIDIVPAN